MNVNICVDVRQCECECEGELPDFFAIYFDEDGGFVDAFERLHVFDLAKHCATLVHADRKQLCMRVCVCEREYVRVNVCVI